MSKKSKGRSSMSTGMKVLVAVIVLGAVAAGLSLINRDAPYEKKEAKYVAEVGQTYRTTLPDSSQMWLNSASELEYIDPDGKFRAVNLSGEAFIAVKLDIDQPFRIHVNELNLTLLSGEVNVEGYPERGVTVVTLKSGQLKANYIGKKLWTVDVGWQLVFNNQTKEGEIMFLGNMEEVNRRLEWMSGEFVLCDMTVGDMLSATERKYGVEIEVSDDVHFSNDLYTIDFTANDTPQLILAQLAEIDTPFTYKVEGIEVYVDKRVGRRSN